MNIFTTTACVSRKTSYSTEPVTHLVLLHIKHEKLPDYGPFQLQRKYLMYRYDVISVDITSLRQSSNNKFILSLQ